MVPPDGNAYGSGPKTATLAGIPTKTLPLAIHRGDEARKGSAQGCHPGCFRKRVRKVLKTKGDARKKERKERQRVRKSLCAKELAGLKAEGVERRGQEGRGTLAFDERPFAKGALGTLVGRPQDDTLIVLAGRGRLGPMDLRDTAMLPRSLQCAARRTKTVRRKKLGRSGRDDGKRIYFLLAQRLRASSLCESGLEGLTYDCDAPLALAGSGPLHKSNSGQDAA